MEPDSINFVSFQTDMEQMSSTVFVCQSFYDKGGRFIGRNSTRLPQVAMVDFIMCLLFAPYAELYLDDTGTYYEKIRLERVESSYFELSHILNPTDLKDINEVRLMLNLKLCTEHGLRSGINEQINTDIRKILSKQRVPVTKIKKLLVLLKDENTKAALFDGE